MDQDNTSSINIGKLIIGLNIMLIGVYILLGNLGIIDFGYLPFFWKLWPVIFIIIGLNIIFRNEGVTYLGSLVVTAMLILIMVASVPGASGAGTRKVMGIHDEPIEFSIQSISDYFVSLDGIYHHFGEVKQTFADSISLEKYSNIQSVEIKVSDRYADRISVSFHPVEKETKIVYNIPIRTNKVLEINPAINLDIDTNGNMVVESPGDIGEYYDISIDVYVPTITDIICSSKITHFSIDGDWDGDINVSNPGTGQFLARNLTGNNSISTNGIISCHSVSNSTLTTTSGTIKVSGCDNMDIKSTSGDIIIGECSNINLKSASGNIRTDIVTGRINISTASGDVRISKISESTSSKIKAVSGNITINDFFSETGNISISSVSGDVDITFSSAASNSIRGSIATTSGDINSKGIDIKNRNFIVGGGKTDMVIKTVSGDVNLRKLEQE